MAVGIETPRLRLRDWREADVAPFVRHTNTPAVMRWLGGVRPVYALESIVRDRLMVWQAERGFTFWAVERRADEALLGFCGIKLADSPGSTVAGWHEIGWRLREDAWGQGYAREAATATLDHGFAVIGAPRIVALTVAGNTASWGLMKRLGMTRRSTLDYDDPRHPELGATIVYTVEAEAWQARS